MDDEIEAFLATLDPEVREIAERLRRLVLALLPGTLEMLDTPSRLFGYGRDRTYKRLICTVAPISHHINLIFGRGSSLRDPDGLLQGSGKTARHLALRSADDVARPGVRALVEEAGRLTP